jgi:dolichol kinase
MFLYAEIVSNVLPTIACYAYVLVTIFASKLIEKSLRLPTGASRKFLHIMIGNLVFIIPFFTIAVFPVMVAAPFIIVTLLASPISPAMSLGKKMKGLADITDQGHELGLVYYAVSYTCLALLFPMKPYVVGVGIIPMAYGDGMASIIGKRFGKIKYKVAAEKSLEGSAAMFLFSLVGLFISIAYFSVFYPFAVFSKTAAILAAVLVATVIEGVSPMGFDNLTIPALSVLIFLIFGGY